MNGDSVRISTTTAASLARLNTLLGQVQQAVDAVRTEIDRVTDGVGITDDGATERTGTTEGSGDDATT